MVLPSSLDGIISVATVSILLLSVPDDDEEEEAVLGAVAVLVVLKLVASGWFTTDIVPFIL